ncbi:phosphatidylinositol transfer protein [Tieghemostelium lacteum]|uniref:Phosphatidylinositol transfer protein n=1 Tax=Tieghemostelium lacteum TaxID=361077 RepID=A0A152A7E9_TIELA|nr:phosphatidylinositol transfer protein [Tieghemostelium lacteum]|eukprot:KYR02124.1 phosphatidylinositol transfer protein [Tieghemostelium lacteum]
MLIKEYRIILPMTTNEYKRGQSYMTNRKTKENSGVQLDVKYLKKHSYKSDSGENGEYTHKIFAIKKSLPKFAVAILPKSALSIEEKSWNSFPHTKTIYSCPFFGDKFLLSIESVFKDGLNPEDNIFNLTNEQLKQRKVDYIDIAHDPIEPKDYIPEEDPKFYISRKTKRGPLQDKNWTFHTDPVMICYKLVTVDFNYWGFQSKVENLVQNQALRNVFFKAHRSLFCWMDEWYELDSADLINYEKSLFEIEHPNQQLISEQNNSDALNVMN